MKFASRLTLAVGGAIAASIAAVWRSGSRGIGSAGGFRRIVGRIKKNVVKLSADPARHSETEAVREWHANRERLFSAAVQSSIDAILTETLDGVITGWNPAAEKLFDFSAEEAIGKSVAIIVPEDRLAEMRGMLLRVRRGDVVEPYETVRLTRARKAIDVSISISAIKEKAIVGVCVIARDITEKKHLERLTKDFVSTVSHELRTPLTSIAGSLGLLIGTASNDMPARTRHLLDLAQANSKRLINLVNDILDMDKLESGKATFKFRLVDVRPLIEQTVEANLGFADTYLVRLRHEVSADGEIWCDADRLVQVVTNLISNAVKFSPPDGEVVVAVARRGEGFRISVSDQGGGVPPEFRSRIFHKFAQADGTNTRRTGGTGLGLSIVREIVGRLGGEVSFADAPERGTVFYVDLPEAGPAIMLEQVQPGAPASGVAGNSQARVA